MGKKTILFLHGFASSARGTKARFFADKFNALPRIDFRAFDFNPTPRDFEYLTVTGMIDRLRQHLLDRPADNIRLIGSSMGALVGLHYAHRFGGIEKMLFLAPALAHLAGGIDEQETQQWQAEQTKPFFHYGFQQTLSLRYHHYPDGLHYLQPPPPAAPIAIVHGRNDDVVPLDGSRAYAARFPDQAQLFAVNSDHLLHNQLDFIWELTQSFLLT